MAYRARRPLYRAALGWSQPVTIDDREIVRAQIGRPTRAPVTVARRCRLGLPVVVVVPPLLDDGTPFPTRHWLACPLACRRVSRLEAGGAVREAEARLSTDEDLAARVRAAHASYAAERDAAVPPDAPRRPTGGVAGAATGVKCMHAHYAHHAAGGDNLLGAEVAGCIEPLDCDRPCVVVGTDGRARRNPEWRERRQGGSRP